MQKLIMYDPVSQMLVIGDSTTLLRKLLPNNYQIVANWKKNVHEILFYLHNIIRSQLCL